MIYLDHAATTPLSDAAKKAIIEHLDDFGNPSSQYELGRQSRLLIEDARERIAKCINADPNEIYFTSGGAEANTWALSSHASMASNIEHHSIRANFDNIKVNKQGVIEPYSFSSINHRYSKLFELASCMYVNNELGTIQPVKDIGECCSREQRYGGEGVHTELPPQQSPAYGEEKQDGGHNQQ